MKSGEQLTWALLAVTALALPKWVFGASLFVQREALARADPWVLPMILLAGLCSLRLVDTSQPLSALFGLVAASYAATPICGLGYECDRYQVVPLLPVVVWIIAATYPNAEARWARTVAVLVSAYGIAAVLTQWAGWSPYFWPAVFGEGFRSWEWAGIASLMGILAIRLRGGRFRLSKAKTKILLLAFTPALVVLTLDFLLQTMGTLKIEGSSLSTPLAAVANLGLGWGIFTLTRAEVALQKESRNEAQHGRTHQL
ncbi:MAG: hypothetical protein AAF690_08465 [Acidobacteriota bacterium]